MTAKAVRFRRTGWYEIKHRHDKRRKPKMVMGQIAQLEAVSLSRTYKPNGNREVSRRKARLNASAHS